MNFADLGLSDDVLKAVADAGYSEPTPIQKEAIPYVLMGRDVLARAQTGTGKTAAFALPMVDILSGGRSRARMPRALILEPTRELAQQVAENFEIFGKHHKISCALIIGGASMAPQELALERGVDVLIATPGRLIDLFERGKIILTAIKVLVIDETDRMLDMGFIPDVERIVGFLTAARQTLFFSATFPDEIRRLAEKFLSNPKEITIKPSVMAAETVEDVVVFVPDRDKGAALRQIVRGEEIANAIIFCNRKKDADVLFRSLKKHGLNVGVLHGDLAQPVRERTLQAFRDNEITLLVASDVAARGLDVLGISHVFNYDVPFNAEDYVHRIGRTGRAGRAGRAFTLATPEDGKLIDAIERLIGRAVPRITIEGLGASEQSSAERAEGGRGGRGRGRPPGGREGRKSGPTSRPRSTRSNAPGADSGTPAEPAENTTARVAADVEPIRDDSPIAAPGFAASGHHEAAQPAARRDVRPDGRQDNRGERRREPRQEHHGERRPSEQAENRRRPAGDDQGIVGLGDHTPAFLLRGARPR